MSIALEIIMEDGLSIDLDRWCHFATIEKAQLHATMSFGSPIIGTDSDEVVEFKKNESAESCDAFLDTIEPFIGKPVTVIYEATKVATVVIPENGGLVGKTLMVWPLQIEKESALAEDEIKSVKTDFGTFTFDTKVTEEIFLKAFADLTAAVQELTVAISGKRKD